MPCTWPSQEMYASISRYYVASDVGSDVASDVASHVARDQIHTYLF